jgi:hypothetical protein
MGMLGPQIRLPVGGSVRIVLRNRLQFPVNMVPQGLRYDNQLVVNPGGTQTYVWTADSSSGPASDDVSSVAYIYRSSVSMSLPSLSRLI